MNTAQPPRFEYEAVRINGAEDVDPALQRMAAAGWQLRGSYESSGYTRRLIFERPLLNPAAAES